ncbi:hypothetical protein PHYSODRAFT_299157 [Phytophthora sojae]|uniref:NADPH--hemoprotein reductase n=1 Tax=Phytophthora sojae (strain P6497) TaxID=1094619 RepID=G4Z2K1_PHYSP|nr:hypothetical protein PHYSODRAFT_299157 [Phytophthora sojae]EGZ21430.1 hypothetical protein PHYSODRAFT_299157 [Phytophthora sojae]|eukprot:XP_009524147.1 hypothetical protein PHYSODRAFT_299157 [Phytophthora sojae]
MSLLPSPEPIPPLEHKPRPPPLQQTRRISLSFRKITQATGCITHLDIFVGSLTGTSERFASILAEDAAKYGTVVSLNSLERFNPECFNDPEGPHHSKSRLTVFVVSTHFAGGPSPDAEAFSQWLRIISGDSRAPTIDPVIPEEPRPSEATTIMAPPVNDPSKPKMRRSTQIVVPTPAAKPRRQTSFSAAVRPILRMNWRQTFLSRKNSANASKPKSVMHGVQYAVFGVGNSMYLTYNAMGKFVDAKMQVLGAVRLCPLGLGDVLGDIDDTFAKWEAQVLQLLVYQKLGPPANIAIQAQAQRRTTFTAEGSGRQLTVQRTLSDPSSGEPAAPRNQPQAPAQEDEVAPLRRSSIVRRASPPRASAGGTTTKFSAQNLYGHNIRLRFRCRYVSNDNQQKSPRKSTKLPPIAPSSEKKASAKLHFNLSTIKRDASHIRHPCIALRSITMLTRADNSASASTFKDVSLVRLSILDPDLAFETADTFGYFPPNPKEVVDAIGSRMGLSMDSCVEFSFQDDPGVLTGSCSSVSGSGADPPHSPNRDRHLPFPSPCSIRTILSDFLELRTISREFVRIASGFVSDQTEHELLENMASIDGSAAFAREFTPAKFGMLKLLELAPSLQMPFEVFVNLTPLLKPRLYSVASSHLQNDREFDIVIALGNPKEAHGLSVSNFRRILSRSDVQVPPTSSSSTVQQAESEPVPVLALLRGFVAFSRFKTPVDIAAPMIMICNGIGVAPLRALLQHREIECEWNQANLEQNGQGGGTAPAPLQVNPSCGKNLLFLGCSNESSLLFESELRTWESNGVVELHVAYSSEPGQPSEHVQDLVSAQKEQIAALMSSSPEARIFICGKIAMAQAVHQILSAPDTSYNNNWYQKALLSGRYIEGIFG